jgi:hypothetical protein
MVNPVDILLPPNSTDLEKRLCDTLPREALGIMVDTLRRFDTSPVILPWLAAEWGLSGFVKYFPTLEELIEAGRPWLLERGTAAAIERVLSWIGMTLSSIEEDGTRLSLDPGRIPSADELADLVYLVKKSIPTHVDLYRIFHGYDLRPIGVSKPEWLDEGLLSDDSGVWTNIDGEDVKLSFGMTCGSRIGVASERTIHQLREDTFYTHTFYADRFRLDGSSLDGEIVPNRRFVTEFIAGLHAAGIDHRPPTLGRRLDIARSALDLDDDIDVLGDLNCGFAGGADIEWNPFVLDDSALSDHDNRLEHIFIDERFADDRRFLTTARPKDGVPTTRADTRAGKLDVWPAATWRGGWDSRTWQAPETRVPGAIEAARTVSLTLPLDGIVVGPASLSETRACLVPSAIRDAQTAASSRHDVHTVGIKAWPGLPDDLPSWSGAWDTRQWRPLTISIPSSITHTSQE